MNKVNQQRTVEALGLVWRLGTNDVMADLERADLEARAEQHIYSAYTRPASQNAAAIILFPYYPDIVSAVEKIEGLDGGVGSLDAAQLLTSPARWLELVAKARQEKRDEEIIQLWEAARECNPHWYPQTDLDLEKAPAEVKAAVEATEQIVAALADPDEAAQLAAETDPAETVAQAMAVVEHVEEAAKKKRK